jgi:hypothetical protein
LLPTVPQNIKETTGNTYKYSTDKYLLYGLDIAIYLDEDIATGALQQNINRLVLEAIPEIIECDDCIRFETMQMNNNTDSSFQEMMAKIEKLEKEKRDESVRISLLSHRCFRCCERRGLKIRKKKKHKLPFHFNICLLTIYR